MAFAGHQRYSAMFAIPTKTKRVSSKPSLCFSSLINSSSLSQSFALLNSKDHSLKANATKSWGSRSQPPLALIITPKWLMLASY